MRILSFDRSPRAGRTPRDWGAYRVGAMRLAPAALAALCGLGAAAVVIDSLFLTIRYFQPVFIDDAWATAQSFKSYRAGTFTLADLFAQHNEHRLAVPRLVFLADFVFGRGLNVINLSAIYAIEALHAGLLIAMASRVCRGPALAILASAIVVLLFSFGQSDNLTFGFQVQFVGVFAAASAAFLCLGVAAQPTTSGLVRLLSTVGAFVAAAVATCMMANGLLCILVMLGLAVALRAGTGLIAATALFAALVLYAYLHGAQFPAPPGGSGQKPPLTLTIYVLTYIGGVFGSFGVSTAATAGFVGSGLALVAALRLTLRVDRDAVRAALVAIMGFVMATAAVVTWGRVGLGLMQALESRYLTPSSIFWAAQLVYWTSRLRPSTGWVPRAAVLMLGGLVAFGAIERHLGQRPAAKWNYMNANLGTDALLSRVDASDALQMLAPIAFPTSLAPFLAEQKLNVFAWPEAGWPGRRIADLLPTAEDGRCAVVLDKRTAVGGGAAVEGWAWDRLRRRPVARIVIADAGGTIVGLGSGGWFRPDFRALPFVETAEPGWKGFAKVSPGEALTAYAVLDSRRVLCASSTRR